MKIYYTRDLPAEYSVPCDYLLQAKAACEGEHIMQVCNLEKDKISFGKSTRSDLFDSSKIKESGIHVDRSRFGGAAMYCGSEDITYSFHINRLALDNPGEHAGKIYLHYTARIAHAIARLGVEGIAIRTEGKGKKDGVCLSLEGRSEVINGEGQKLVGSVYKDDGLVISIQGLILISDAWVKIYDYIRGFPTKANAISLRTLVPGVQSVDLIGLLCGEFPKAEFASYTDKDMDTMKLLAPTFGYDKWQA